MFRISYSEVSLSFSVFDHRSALNIPTVFKMMFLPQWFSEMFSKSANKDLVSSLSFSFDGFGCSNDFPDYQKFTFSGDE